MDNGVWILIITMALNDSNAQLEHIPAFTTKEACEEAAAAWKESMKAVYPPRHTPGVITTRTSRIGWATNCVYSGDYILPPNVASAGSAP